MKRSLSSIAVVLLMIGLPLSSATAFNPQPDPPKASSFFDVFTPAGKKLRATRVGNVLYLVGEDGKRRPAGNGRYRMGNGKMIIIINGKISPKGYGGPDTAPANKQLKSNSTEKKTGLLLPAVQKAR